MRRSLVRILIVGAVLLPFALLYLGTNQADDGFNRACDEIGGTGVTIRIMPPKGRYEVVCWVPLTG